MTALPLAGEWCLEPLTADHDVSAFTCEEPAAVDYLRQEALRSMESGGAATHVLVRPGERRVRGYFTLLGHQIERNQLTRAEKRGLGHRSAVPATLLAWIARSAEHRGEGLGEVLLLQAFRVAVESAGQVGSAVLVLDAMNDKLVKWYEAFGLRQLKRARPRRLYITIPELRALSIARPEPPGG